MFLEIIKFLGQEDIHWDEILYFFHLFDSVLIKFSEHKIVQTIKGKLIKNLSSLPSER